MLKLTILEVFLRSLPEEFLVVFAVYVFSKTVFNIKRYIISSILFLLAVYMIRLLPIQYGVHTILNVIVIIVLTVNINKMSIIESIKASIMALILEFVCEGINMMIIQHMFKAHIMKLLTDPFDKILYGIPSLVIFAIMVLAYYFYLARKEKLKEVINGEII